MRKIYELDNNFFTGESTVQPVVLWGRDGKPLRERFSKTASEASDYIKSVTPEPGKSIVLVLALGAYETYGLNRNGDGFNEHPYKVGLRPSCGHRDCESDTSNGWVSRGELITDHYKTFEEHGKIYMHHKNKDPGKSYGDVLKAFWNPQMHRVELLLGIDNAKAPELVQRIADGEYPAVSMGCRIKYDRCTICGHKAPTRAEYCDHLKFNMRQVMSSGLQAGALNPSPKFFDISFVVRPADQTGYMLKKVAEFSSEVKSSAELGEAVELAEVKRASIRKLSEMDKFVTGQTAKADVSSAMAHLRDDVALPVARHMPSFDRNTLRGFAQHAPSQVLSTLAAGGVHLTTAELLQMLVDRMSPGASVPSEALDAATYLQPLVLGLLEEHPGLLEQVLETGAVDMSPAAIKPEIAEKAAAYLEKRSTIGDYIIRNLIPANARTEQRPTTDVLHITDPVTGNRYATTRGAAYAASDRIDRAQLLKILGGGALLAGAHKIVSAGLPSALRPVSAGVAGLAGFHFLRPNYGAQYMTDEGISVPVSTEFAKASSDGANVAIPLLGGAGLVTALAHDYESRLRRGDYVNNPSAPLHTRVYDRLSQMAHDNPGYSFLASLAAYGMGNAALKKFAEYLGPFESPAENGVDSPRANFDKVAERIGALIWPR